MACYRSHDRVYEPSSYPGPALGETMVLRVLVHVPLAAVCVLASRRTVIADLNTDEIAVEMAARLLCRYWLTGAMPVLKELR